MRTFSAPTKCHTDTLVHEAIQIEDILLLGLFPIAPVCVCVGVSAALASMCASSSAAAAASVSAASSAMGTPVCHGMWTEWSV